MIILCDFYFLKDLGEEMYFRIKNIINWFKVNGNDIEILRG